MIEVRPLRFNLEDVPRHWHGGQKSVTAYFDNLSVFFPEGERFFVRSVKNLREHADGDATLSAEVDAFCAQEGHHSREHVRYNRWLLDKGYPIVRMEARISWLLKRATCVLSKRRQLAVTCALEHFTSLMGSLVLSHPRILEGAHPELAALWRWHAAEENEHKSVAFDLYRRAGGTWFERVRTMVIITLVFWLMVFVHQLQLSRVEGILWSPREWFRLFDFLFLKPGGLQSLAGAYFAYYRPSFDPRRHDTTHLLEAWKVTDAAAVRARTTPA